VTRLLPDSHAARARLLVALLALPALGSAIFFTRFVVNRVLPEPPRPEPTAAALLDVVSGSDVLRAWVLVNAGVDTNAPHPFSNRSLTNDEEVLLTPLMLAAARGDENMVRMLLTYAPGADAAHRRMASCLALSRGDGDLAALILSGAPPDTPCPAGLDTLGQLRQITARLRSGQP